MIIILLGSVLLATPLVGTSITQNSYNSNIVKASSLKRTYIPKRLRGNWYWNGHHLSITANTITGYEFGYRRNTHIYKGSNRTLYSRHLNQRQIIFWQTKRTYHFALDDSQPISMYLTKKHGHQMLKVHVGIGSGTNYYRSRAVSKKYRNH